MADLDELQQKIVAFRDERNWQQFHNPKDMALSMVLEATEFLEHFQWKNGDEVTEYLKGAKREDLEDELADVLYWVLLIAHDLDIDVKKTVARKMAKNALKYPVDQAKGKHTKYTDL